MILISHKLQKVSNPSTPSYNILPEREFLAWGEVGKLSGSWVGIGWKAMRNYAGSTSVFSIRGRSIGHFCTLPNSHK